jgi:hypothetical protein
MNLIVCFNQKNVIGAKNAIPWHLPSDLKRFKHLTQGHIVVMGRKTYESLPVKPLPNRINIVITSNPENFEPKENIHFIHITYAVPFLLEEILFMNIFFHIVIRFILQKYTMILRVILISLIIVNYLKIKINTVY